MNTHAGVDFGSRWNPQFVPEFGLLGDANASVGQAADRMKKHWDSDSDGLSDAESSTSKGSSDKSRQFLQLPPWLLGQPLRSVPAQKCPLGLPPITIELLQVLSEEVGLFSSWADLQDIEAQERQEVQLELQTLVLQLWPSATIELFGSSACGLALPSSDLDLVIEGIEDFNPNFPLPHLALLSDTLRASGITELSIIPNAKVPIVKYCHPRARVWVDVSFTVLNSTRCIPLVKEYLESYPLLRPLTTVFKTLLRQHGLHKPHDGGLGSYAVVLLLVSFLRLREQSGDVHNPIHLGPLVVDFLRYFSNYGTQFAFTPGAKDHPIDMVRGIHGRLEIWDPLDPDNNVAFSCRRVERIQAIFGIAVGSLAWYSPRHCASVLASFISPNDPCLRMPLPSSKAPLPSPPDCQHVSSGPEMGPRAPAGHPNPAPVTTSKTGPDPLRPHGPVLLGCSQLESKLWQRLAAQQEFAAPLSHARI